MIPKASQRGLGQDLATHLQNAYDNEYVEIAHAFYDQGEPNFVNSVLDRVARQARSAELVR